MCIRDSIYIAFQITLSIMSPSLSHKKRVTLIFYIQTRNALNISLMERLKLYNEDLKHGRLVLSLFTNQRTVTNSFFVSDTRVHANRKTLMPIVSIFLNTKDTVGEENRVSNKG